MITKTVVVITLIVLMIKAQIYQERYMATTTPEYRNRYGRKTYDSQLYRFATTVYFAAVIVAAITLFILFLA